MDNQLTDEQIREALQPIIDLMIARRQTVGSLWAFDDERPTPKITVPDPLTADEEELERFCAFLSTLEEDSMIWDVLRTVMSQYTPAQFRKIYEVLHYREWCME